MCLKPLGRNDCAFNANPSLAENFPWFLPADSLSVRSLLAQLQQPVRPKPRRAFVFVLAVDVAAFPRGDHVPDPFGPLRERLLIVGASPQADVPKICCVPAFGGTFVGISGHP